MFEELALDFWKFSIKENAQAVVRYLIGIKHEEGINYMAKHEDPHVRSLVAPSNLLTEKSIQDLCQDHHRDVLLNLSANPKLNEAQKLDLMKTVWDLVPYLFTRNPNITKKDITTAQKLNASHHYFGNPNAKSDVLVYAISISSISESDVNKILKTKACTAKVLFTIAQHWSGINKDLITHPNANSKEFFLKCISKTNRSDLKIIAIKQMALKNLISEEEKINLIKNIAAVEQLS